MKSEQPTVLEHALTEYVKMAGVPVFIRSGSDYKLMGRVLQSFSKSLRRKFTGALIGKYVVPLTVNR